MSSPAMAAQAKRFDVILKRPENRECFDCTSKQPRWASTNLGIFFCLRCAGIHRSLGVHISKVKSTTMDLWEESMIDCCDHVGNERARSLYEALAPPGHRKPDSTTDTSIVERLLRQKYVDRKYFAKNAEEARDMMIATGLSQQASNKSSTGTPSLISTPSAFASGGAAPVAVARVAPAAAVPARPAPATNSTVSLFQSDDGWSDFHTSSSSSSPATAPSPPTTTTATTNAAATSIKGTTVPSHFDDFFQAQPQRNAQGPSMDLYFGSSQPATTSAPHAAKPAAQMSVDQLFQGSSGSTSSHHNHPPHGHGSARNGHHGNDSHDIFGDWTKSTHHSGATTSNHHPPRAGPTFSNSSSSFGSVGGAHHHHHHPHHPNTTNHGHSSSSSKPHHHSSSSSSSSSGGHMTDAQREMLSMMRPNNGPRASPAVTASTTSSIDSFF